MLLFDHKFYLYSSVVTEKIVLFRYVILFDLIKADIFFGIGINKFTLFFNAIQLILCISGVGGGGQIDCFSKFQIVFSRKITFQGKDETLLFCNFRY